MRNLAMGVMTLGLLGVVLVPRAAFGSGNTCFYNGVKLDGRYEPPKDFTGEYSCKDMDSGTLTLREHRVAGLPEGEFIKYVPGSNEIDETGHYKAGKLDGVLRRFRKGSVYLEQSYVAGKLRGVQRELKDGVPSRIFLIGADGSRDTSYGLNKQGQLTQLECKVHPIGPRDAAWCGFDGKQSTVTIYDDAGRVRALEQYLNGKQHGTSKRMNVATGAVIQEAHYDNGKRLKDGEQFFDRQGLALAKTDCDATKTVCTETSYFAGGKQVHTVSVHNGLALTKRTEYFQNGKPSVEVIADGPKFKKTAYYDNGQMESQGTFVSLPRWDDYLPDGVVESYDERGVMVARETYARGRLQGRVEHFGTSDGKKVREEAEYDKDAIVRQKIYSNGALVDESEYFPDGSIKSHKAYAPAAAPQGI
jgi:antitoxin component YwqK of YwqJK toxin-antitoxin module